MRYSGIERARFLVRKNRFICDIEIDGMVYPCHVKNTGRLGELLLPNAEAYVQRFDTEKRKTAYDLIAVKKGDDVINIDSLAPNAVVAEYLRELYPNGKIFPERKYGNSRFDFYIENGNERGFIEVKGVTLFRDGKALFPDAPTERGIKHLCELTECVRDGYTARVIFVIAADSRGDLVFSPNRAIGNDFADALRLASESGVKITALDCTVTPSEIKIKSEIGVSL